MSEENVKNPMDLNGDGKVTLGEKVQYNVGKAQEKVEKAINDIAADAKDVAGKVVEKGKEYYDVAADKAKDVADKAKDVYAEAKEKGKEYVEKGKEYYDVAADKAKDVYADAKEKGKEFVEDTKAKVQEFKDKV